MLDLELAQYPLKEEQRKIRDKIGKKLSKWDGSFALELLLKQAYIRSLIRSKNWKQTIEFSDKTIEKFPWISNLYNLRAIAHFHLERMADYKEDILESIHLEKINLVPIVNMPSLLFSRYTHIEAQLLFDILGNYLGRDTRDLKGKILSHYISNALKKYVKNRKFIPKVPLSKILKMIKFSKSQALDMLAEHYSEINLKNKLSPADFKEFKEKVKEKEKSLLKFHLLLCYFLKNQKKISHLIYGKNKNDRKKNLAYLRKFLKEEEHPIIQALATKMLLDLKDIEGFRILIEAIHQEKFPFCFIAFSILKDYAHTPAYLLHEFSFRKFMKIPGNLENKEIYQFYAVCCNNLKFYEKWIHKDLSPLAFILLVDQLGYSSFQRQKKPYKRKNISYKWKEIIDPKLKKMMLENLNSKFRGMACYIYWKHRLSAHNFKVTSEILEDSLVILEQNLQEKEPRAQLSAMKSMTGGFWVRNAKHIKSSKLNKIKELLLKHTPKKSNQELTIRNFWSVIALSIFLPEENRKILRNSSSPLLLRIGIPLYTILAHQEKANIIRLITNKNSSFQKYVDYCLSIIKDKKIHSENNLKFKQFALTMLPWLQEYIPIPFCKENLNKVIFSALNDKNLCIRQSALTALMWCRKKFPIQKLEKISWNSTDKISRRVATVSLALLYLQHKKPKSCKAFFERASQMDIPTRKTIAWACRFYVLRETLKKNYLEEIKNFKPEKANMLDETTKVRLIKKYHDRRKLLKILDFAQKLLKDISNPERKNFLYYKAFIHLKLPKKGGEKFVN